MYNNKKNCKNGKNKQKWVIAFAMALSLAQSGRGQSTLDNPVITNDLILHGGTVRNWGPMNFRSDYDQSGDQEFNFKYSNNTNFIRFLPVTRQVDMSAAAVTARKLIADTLNLKFITSQNYLRFLSPTGNVGTIEFFDRNNNYFLAFFNAGTPNARFYCPVTLSNRVSFAGSAVFTGSFSCETPALFSDPLSCSNNATFEGTVGIGTGTFVPNHQLVVNGSARASSFVTSAARFPDYVFEKDYSLPSLEEVKIYTETNKKLPGMPSEEEVLRDGMNLNEVSIRSVEKIEELYLYIFQMNEKMRQLEQELKLIKQQ